MVAPLLAAAGVTALGSVVGGVAGGKGAKKAAKISAQAQAAQRADALANRDYQYDLNAPQITHGTAADDRISALLRLGGDPAEAEAAFGAFQDSTGYQFRRDQGLDAINQRGFAGGTGMSGATLKGGIGFGQNIASDEFLRYLQQLGGVSSTGANARGLVAGVGNNSTQQLINVAQVGAQQQIGATNAQTANTQQLIQNLVNAGGFAYGSSYGKSGGGDGGFAPGYPTPGYGTGDYRYGTRGGFGG